MSTPPEQSGPLADSDLYIIKEWIIQTAVSFLIYGIYATFSLIAIYHFLSHGALQSKAQSTLFLVTVFMLIVSTAVLVVEMKFILFQLPMYGFTPPDPTSFIRLLTNFSISGEFLGIVNFLVSDGVVVWRAWIMYPENRMVKCILSICLLASCVGSFVDAGTGAARILRNFQDYGTREQTLLLTLPLFITNFTATSLIGYRAWCHRKAVASNLSSSRNSMTRVQKILLLLVESGLVYCTLWIAYTVISISGNPLTISFQVYTIVMPLISALYPVLIILLSALEKSRDDPRNERSLSHSIRFASGPAVNESDSSDSLDHSDLRSRAVVVTISSSGYQEQNELIEEISAEKRTHVVNG